MTLGNLPKRFHPDFKNRAIKPGGRVELDSTCELASKARFFYSPASVEAENYGNVSSFERVDGDSLGTIHQTQWGLCHSDTEQMDGDPAGLEYPFTFYARFTTPLGVVSAGNKYGADLGLLGTYDGTWRGTSRIRVAVNSSNIRCILKVGGSSFTLSVNKGTRLQTPWDGVVDIFVEFVSSTEKNLHVYIDGAYIGTATESTDTSADDADFFSNLFTVTPSNSASVATYSLGLFDGLVSKESLVADPYQLLKPKKPIYLAGDVVATSYTLDAESGSLTLSGTDAGLLFNRSLPAGTGALNLSGTDAGLLFDRSVQAASAALSLVGTDANLLFNRSLAADSGDLDLTGTDAALLYNRVLQAESGALNLVGTDVNFIYGVGYTLIAESGNLTLSGTDAKLTFNRKLNAESGVLSLSGTDAGLYVNYRMSAESGAFTLSGTDANLLYNRVLSAESGELTLTGTSLNLIYSGAGVFADIDGVISVVSLTPHILITSKTS